MLFLCGLFVLPQPARIPAASVLLAAAYVWDRYSQRRYRGGQFAFPIFMLWGIARVLGWLVSHLPSSHQQEVDFIDAHPMRSRNRTGQTAKTVTFDGEEGEVKPAIEAMNGLGFEVEK